MRVIRGWTVYKEYVKLSGFWIMKERLGQLKELAGKLSDKTKKIIIAGVAVLIVAAIAIALASGRRHRV